MILLTGVTGKTGGAAAQALIDRGVSFRALVRDAGKATAIEAAGAELVIGDAADKATVQKALAGIDTAFLTLPNSEQQLMMEKQFVDCAAEAGVNRLVKQSSMEAIPEARSPIPSLHWQSEEYIRGSGLAWTMLKPNFFMQNFLGAGGTIQEQKKFFMPMGEGTTVMIDCRDIGAVAAEVLTGQGHESQSYEISGPEKLSFYDVADRFSEVLGEKIEYVDMPADAYRGVLSKILTQEWHLNAVCDLFGEIREGATPMHVTDTVEQLIGRKPISLVEFIKDHLAVFKAA
jgi:uncharacterized protein YbjT (DUF2867 family)